MVVCKYTQRSFIIGPVFGMKKKEIWDLTSPISSAWTLETP